MAQKQKRPSPHDVPPSVSSDDEPIPSSQPESEEKDDEEEEDRDEQSSEEEEEEDDDEEVEKTQPQSKNPKSAVSSESVTDSDSGSESESESRDASNYQIQPKPLASKPVDETPINANSKSSKRPVESNGSGDVNLAKKKKVSDAASSEYSDDDEDGGVETAEVKKSSGAGSDSKSLPFQRLFSEEDEIAILKGMIEFKKETGNDPFKFVNAFHRFVSKSLHIDASSNQLKDKIQRLKRKFKANAKGKSFTKRHDEEAFELSKKIWDNADAANEVVKKAKSNGKAPESVRKEGSRGNEVPLKSIPEPKKEVKLLMYSKDSNEEAVNMETDEETNIPFSIMQGFGSYGLNENMAKKGLDLMGASDRAKLEKQWKELEAAEFEASVKRLELVAKHARLIWEANKASNH